MCACRGHIKDSYVRIPKMVRASRPLPSAFEPLTLVKFWRHNVRKKQQTKRVTEVSLTVHLKLFIWAWLFCSGVLGLQQEWLQHENQVYSNLIVVVSLRNSSNYNMLGNSNNNNFKTFNNYQTFIQSSQPFFVAFLFKQWWHVVTGCLPHKGHLWHPR